MPPRGFSRADMDILEDVMRPAILEQAHPSVWESVPWIPEKREQLAQTTTHGRFQREAHGFSPDRTTQHLASIPFPIWVALLELDPEFETNAAKQDQFLNGPGKMFKL